MKTFPHNLIYLLVSVIASLSLSSCELLEVEPGISIFWDDNYYDLPSSKEEYRFWISSSLKWTVEIDQPWVYLDRSSARGGDVKVRLTTEANDKPYKRSATISFKSKDLVRTLKIQQNGIDPILNTDLLIYNVNAEGGVIDINVNHNMEYTVSMPWDADWIHKDETKGKETTTHRFIVDRNDGWDSRTTKIGFRSTNKEMEKIVAYYAEILQTPKDSIIVPELVVVPAEERGHYMEVKANVSHYVKTDSPWIHYDNKHSGFFEVDRYDGPDDYREGQLIFSVRKVEKRTTIRQYKPSHISIDHCEPETVIDNGDFSIGVPYTKTDFKIYLDSNLDFTVSNVPEWLTLKTDNRTVCECHVEENTDTRGKMARVRLTLVDGHSVELFIYQRSPYDDIYDSYAK